jgi:hypothetical protein
LMFHVVTVIGMFDRAGAPYMRRGKKEHNPGERALSGINLTALWRAQHAAPAETATGCDHRFRLRRA